MAESFDISGIRYPEKTISSVKLDNIITSKFLSKILHIDWIFWMKFQLNFIILISWTDLIDSSQLY